MGVRRVFSVLFWCFFAASGLAYFIVACLLWLLTLPFDRQRRINHWWSCVWASTYAYAYPGWSVRVTGRELIEKGQAYVLVANHTSIADVVLLFALFRQFKWVSKTAVFRYPLLGWNMSLSKYVPLERGDKASIERMLETCRGWLRRGMSVLMFPEGTRSKDGRLQTFKHGAFTLAKDTGVPVVPIAIHGGHLLIPKNQGTFAPKADLWVQVLPPIESEGVALPELVATSRQAIATALSKGPAPVPADEPVAEIRSPSLPSG